MTAPRIAERYEVLRPLGEGPLGKVYQVLDHARGGAFAALKILRAEAVREEGLEERVADLLPRLAEVDHPFVRVPFDVGRTPLGLVFLCSEFADGEDLRAVLRRRGALHPRRVLAIARGLCEALAALHERDLVHGDLHPGNVLLAHRAAYADGDPFGTEVVLLDPCALAITGAAPPEDRAPYAAPELASGSPTPASDVYAAGAILLELLLGRAGGAPADAPALLVQALEGALAADPARRYEDALAFLDALPAGEDARETAALAAELAELRRAYDQDVGTSFQRLAQRDAALAALRAELETKGGGGPAELEAARAEALELRRRVDELSARKRGVAPVLAGVFAAAAALALVMWLKTRSAVPVLAHESEQRVEAAEEQLASVRGELQASLAAKEKALGEARAELEAFKASAEEHKGAAEGLRAELARTRALADEKERSLAEASEAQAELAQRQAALQEELVRARDPELAALDQLDRVLAALDQKDGAAARARAQLLALNHPDLDGLEGVQALADGALALERAEAARDPLEASERLGEATLALARAGEAVPRTVDASWVRREGDRRAANVEAAHRGLEGELGAARAALDAVLEARWRELVEAGPDVDPREPLAIAAWFDDGRLADFVDAYAAHLRRETERDGALDVPKLLLLPHLDAWAEVVAGDPALAESAGGGDVLLFRYARAWRAAPATEPAPAHPVRFQGQDGGPPAGGWRASLALRAALVGPEMAWPGEVGARYLYHVRASASGAETENWQLDEVVERDGDDAWIVHRTYHRADGSFLNDAMVRIERRGRRFVEPDGGGVLFDAASDLAPAPPFEPGTDVRPPATLIDPSAWRTFRESLRADPPAALAFESDGLTSWYSPSLGLLAKEDAQRFRRELAWASP